MLRISKDRNKNQGLYQMFFRSSMIVMLLAFVLGIAGCGSDDPLPKVSDFESRLTKVVTAFYDDFDIDAKKEGFGVRDYKISQTGKTITCDYGNPPNTLIAEAEDGKIKSIQVISTLEYDLFKKEKKELTREEISTLVISLMIPAGLISDEYVGFENIQKLKQNIAQNGTERTIAGTTTIVWGIDGVKYVITHGNGIWMFTIFIQDSESSDAKKESSSNAKEARQ